MLAVGMAVACLTEGNTRKSAPRRLRGHGESLLGIRVLGLAFLVLR